MNHLPFISTLFFMLTFGCAVPEAKNKNLRQSTVFPSFTLFSTDKPVPLSIISKLPNRIERLPQGASISIIKLLKMLGLTAYSSNVTTNIRCNAYYMYLDAEHVIYMLIDQKSLHDEMDSPTTPWNAHVLSCQWDAHVVTCELLKNPGKLLAKRNIVELQ